MRFGEEFFLIHLKIHCWEDSFQFVHTVQHFVITKEVNTESHIQYLSRTFHTSVLKGWGVTCHVLEWFTGITLALIVVQNQSIH